MPKSRSQAIARGLSSARSLAAGAVAFSALAVQPLHGDIYSSYTNDDLHGYIVQNMPDFDQVREGLPNLGRCYCGPAAISDLLGYVSTHGYPDIQPGVPEVSWADDETYDDLTTMLRIMGAGRTNPGPMDETGGCGTGLRDLRTILERRLGYRFDVYARGWSRSDPDDNPPRITHLTSRLAADGAIGIMHGGRWDGEAAIFPPNLWLTDGLESRSGGHYQAVNRAFIGPDVRRVGLRNSAHGGSSTTQSVFTTEFHDMVETELDLDGRRVVVDAFGGPDGGRLYVLESFITIAPKWFFSWGEFSGTVERVMPAETGWRPGIDVLTTDFPGSIGEAAIAPSGRAMYGVVNGSLYRAKFGSGDGEPAELLSLPPGFQVTGSIGFDAKGFLAMVCNDQLVKFDVKTGKVMSAVQLPGEGTALSLEHGPGLHDSVVIPEMNMLALIQAGPAGDPFVTEIQLPGGVQLNHDTRMAMLPSGMFFLLTDGRIDAFQLTPNGVQQVWTPIPRNGEWNDMAVDVNDVLCIVDQQGMIEAFENTEAGLVRRADHALDGEQTAGRFLLNRSRSILPNDASDEAGSYGNPDIVVDCDGDLNFDGRVDTADLGLLLAEWGNRFSLADLNGNGEVESADLGLLLSLFGNCE